MRIRIDEARCEGHGRCWETAPDLIEDDDRGRGMVRDPGAPVAPEHEDQARRAVNVCPERAVLIDD